MAQSDPDSEHSPTVQYVVGIDIRSEQCSFSVLRPDKSSVMKALDFANATEGYGFLLKKLEG